MATKRLTLEDFWKRKRVIASSGCWEYTGHIMASGYGRLSFGGNHNYLAHRLAYKLTFGSIPDGMLVCHKCDNRKCINPDHLFLGTHLDNTFDMLLKNRHPTMGNWVTCKNGHDRDQHSYLYFDKSGTLFRICRVCKYEYNKEYKQRLRKANKL